MKSNFHKHGGFIEGSWGKPPCKSGAYSWGHFPGGGDYVVVHILDIWSSNITKLSGLIEEHQWKILCGFHAFICLGDHFKGLKIKNESTNQFTDWSKNINS